MLIEIITLFPDGIRAMLNESIPARAQRFEAVEIELIQLRDFATDKHHTVDDKPLGGGPGMVLKVEPIANCIRHLRKTRPEPEPYIIYTSPQGRQLDQDLVEELAKKQRLTIICGHYKGLDQRAIDEFIDTEISIGDYILSGGEIPAVAIADSIIRLQPGVLGDAASAMGDSFTRGLLDHPHYTQPAEWEGIKAPDVLLSGHHAKIDEWREKQAVDRTKKLRPDIYEKQLGIRN
ncbi:MAG: tRNA (guanosine(37)-N1)-methyltransferase TrmD [Candidatus Electryonea clarkiae]|nr:tRNA (guanosine(37)-N1)-methyltransferase TrmD [Candidatus Electryonea clarkiae]MDP8286529.1 tRNA (guanosine(37)-N1)-methyltransferase TrmD [Candidatus Electryonea clarkiae]